MFVGPWESSDDKVLFALFAKNIGSPDSKSSSASETLAGVIGFLQGSSLNLSLEIGAVITLPAFQRTHITSNAVGLLLQYCFELPPTGLGLRRVQWQADATNNASVNFATRFGFIKEGVKRWERTYPSGSGKKGNGLTPRKGDPRADCPGRDTCVFGIAWDEWESGGKDKVEALMKPREEKKSINFS